MMKSYLLLILILISGITNAQFQKPQSTEAIAELAIERGLKEVDLGIYGGTLFMHAMSELAVVQHAPKTLNRALEIFGKFKTKEIKGRGSFISYEAGGTGVAYLNYLNKSPNLTNHVFEYAKSQLIYTTT